MTGPSLDLKEMGVTLQTISKEIKKFDWPKQCLVSLA